MRPLAFALLLSLAALPLSSARASGSCKGLKPAHCFCRVTGGPHSNARPGGELHIDGQLLFTYTVENKCFNQAMDWPNEHLGKGCWLACRQAFGVDATVAPAVSRLKAEAQKKLRAMGGCGGWMNGPLEYAAGTNKYRAATNVGVGITIGGSFQTVNGKQVCR